MKKEKEFNHRAIIKKPCPNCSNLCSPQARNCPKCGEPLEAFFKPIKTGNSSKSKKEDNKEKDYLKLLESTIGKEIPLVNQINRESLGYKEDNGQITGLALPHCGLKALPLLINELKFIKALFLNNNRFTTLPKPIGLMPSLETLRLDNNQLITLPNFIEALSSLKTLGLNRNQLESLPNAIESLSSLQNLYLRRNNLEKLPNTIGFLPSIEKIDLRINKLTSLPRSIGSLSTLKELNLSSNKLCSIPETMGKL
ncbi:MAG: leucine-rich repeat domain-containing protein, partial [Promethearchaeota archaeon]